MARNCPGFRAYLEYGLARSSSALLRALPLSAAAYVGRCIAGAFWALDARHRHRVCNQIEQRLQPAGGRTEAQALSREVYTHFGTMLAEIVRIPTLTPATIDRHVQWQDTVPAIQELLAEGKGLIYATGHLGNWEVAGYAYHLKGLSAGAVARPLDNPLLDRHARDLREYAGHRIFDKFGAMRSALRVLRQRRAFGILMDQDAGKRGVFAPFCGAQASTIPSAADLALRTGAPILPAAMHRDGHPMHFVARHGAAVRANPDANPRVERLRILTEINRQLEELLRMAPEQWLWLHRRWKTSPPNAEPEGS